MRIICKRLLLNGGKNLFCAAEVLLHVLGAGLRGLLPFAGVGNEGTEGVHELLGRVDGPASSAGDDVARLLELLVFGPEDDGLAEGDGFQYIVDAHAKAAADISHVGIAVEFRKEADVVDDEDFARFAGITR